MSESHSSRHSSAADDLPRFVDKLRAGKPILFRPRGRSMTPAIADGAVMMIDPVQRALAIYDVALVLLDGGHIVLHRIMHLSDNGVWLMGDAHLHTEGPLPKERIVGLARVEPLHGFAALRMKLRRALFMLSRLGRF